MSATSGVTYGTIQLTINNPYMLINGLKRETDSGFGAVPILKDNRTFLPVRAIVETVGGTMQWDGAEKKVTIKSNEKTVELWIDKNDVRVNNIPKTMDTAPFISSTGRTMLPLRFIADNLDLDIAWDAGTQVVTVKYGDLAAKPQDTSSQVTDVWSGTWDTDWGEIVLVQEGNKVTGTYDYYEGCELTGTVSGNKLTGTYVDKVDTGEQYPGLFELTMNENWTFDGWRGESSTAKEDWSAWHGERAE